jgi:hypothetical protein
MKLGRRFHALLMLCGCIAATSPISAQQPKPLVLENFTERLSKDVPVSGRMLVGAFVSRSGADKAPVSLEPRLLWRGRTGEAGKEPLCITLASRDGQYYGEGKLSATTLENLLGPTPVRGDHSPSTQKHLGALPQNDLAMLAVAGDCRLGSTDGKPAAVHVLDRRADLAPSGQTELPGEFTLHLVLNSMIYTVAVEAIIPNVGVRSARCRTLDDAQRNKAFNTICELTVPNAATVADLVIQRRRYERPIEPVKFKIAWSAL